VVRKRTLTSGLVTSSGLWRWARRRQQNKNPKLAPNRYYLNGIGGWDGTSSGKTFDDGGHRIRCGCGTPVARPETKSRSRAKPPVRPAYEFTSSKRERSHSRKVSGYCTLRFLWHEQAGLVHDATSEFTRITGWRIHYCVPVVLGVQRVRTKPVDFIRVPRQVHRLHISISKSLSPKEAVRRTCF